MAGPDIHVPREHRLVLPEVEGPRVADVPHRRLAAGPAGLLEGTGETSRVAKFADADDLAAKAEGLRALVRAWIDSRA